VALSIFFKDECPLEVRALVEEVAAPLVGAVLESVNESMNYLFYFKKNKHSFILLIAHMTWVDGP